MDAVIQQTAKENEACQRLTAIPGVGPVTDEKGLFKIADLPPGQYQIFAWENVPDGAPQDF